MTRNTIIRIFVAALAALGGCVVLLLVAGGVALSGSVLIRRGPDIVGLEPGPVLGVVIALGVLSVLLAASSWVLSVVAWIAALVETERRPDKVLFIALLVVGLLGMVLIADLVYLVSTGSDSTGRTELTGRRGAAVAEPFRQ